MFKKSLISVSLIGLLISGSIFASIDDGLIAYYPFDGNANDMSGNMNDGTEFGGVTYNDGIMDLAVNLDGINDYIDVPNELLSNGGDWSFSGWVNGRGYILSNKWVHFKQ